MNKFLRIGLWTGAGLVFAGTFAYLYLNSRPPEVVYELVSPTEGATVERSTVLTGKIEPRDEIAVKPQISGIVAELLVEPGQVVSEGDIIARIKVIPDAQSLSSARSRVTTAEIASAEAESRHQRTSALYARRIVSREEYETSEAALLRARADLDAARDALSIVRDGATSADAGESNTNVRATVSGIVLDVPVRAGSSVIQANTMNDGTTVATIADMSRLMFRGSVDETEVGLLSVGQPMRVTVGAIPDCTLDAVLEYISPKGSDASGANTFEIKGALVSDTTLTLRSGYSANADVMLQGVSGVMTVPESVVEFVGDSTFVYLLTDSVPRQQWERVAVETGLSDGINIEVKSGLLTGALLRGSERR